MEPLIIKNQINGASVITIRNQLLSYDYVYRKCTYPYTGTTKKGEYFTIKISAPIYNEIVKEVSISINSTTEINLFKYIINKLY